MAVFQWQDWLQKDRPQAVLIAGPTASGKSALALEIAAILNAEIINADSMQVYKDLQVLSARPTAAEEAQRSHHLYGFVESGEEFSVGTYLRAIAPVLEDLAARRTPAIIVGGTGLYFKALIEGLTETPPIPASIKAEIAAIDDLHAALAACDPAMAQRLNPADKPRLQRALEVFEATGRSLRDWWQEGEATALLKPGSWRGLVLAPDRNALAVRINTRFDAMIAEGAMEEARRIKLLGLPRNRGIMKAHGMPHLLDHLDGLLSLKDAIELGKNDTRRYAKRQGTFFRSQLSGFDTISF
jgi:tRNA dimethylallyltransferase